MPSPGWYIRFDVDGRTMYAGAHKGAMGWAPTMETAMRFDSPESAGRHAANGYGAMARYAVIVDENDDEREDA